MNSQTLDSLKMNIIVEITHLNDEVKLRQIAETVDKVKRNANEEKLEKLKQLAKPMRQKTTIDDLIREQNWQPIDRKEFDDLVREIDIQEPLEQLIADIGK